MMCHKNGNMNKMECQQKSCTPPPHGMGMERKMMFIENENCKNQHAIRCYKDSDCPATTTLNTHCKGLEACTETSLESELAIIEIFR